MKIKVINKSKYNLPEYATPFSAGVDVYANIVDPIHLKPNEHVLIPTGLKMEIPVGYEIQVRPRSGWAAKYGLTVLNSPGTIDADFRGEAMVILINHSKDEFIINPGERIGQFVLNKFEIIEWEQVDDLSKTERGEGGFGSTNEQIKFDDKQDLFELNYLLKTFLSVTNNIDIAKKVTELHLTLVLNRVKQHFGENSKDYIKIEGIIKPIYQQLRNN